MDENDNLWIVGKALRLAVARDAESGVFDDTPEGQANLAHSMRSLKAYIDIVNGLGNAMPFIKSQDYLAHMETADIFLSDARKPKIRCRLCRYTYPEDSTAHLLFHYALRHPGLDPFFKASVLSNK